jgi:uncharacterized protein YyaL (SSP411 family)
MSVALKLKTLLLLSASLVSAGEPAAIHWQDWSGTLFQQAARENKFVLLDLEAVWCHWCHVMAETTYKDPEVVQLIQSRYIPVRVDQDARPDLSNRYEDYGWPATIVFGSNGKEIVMRSGYMEPRDFAALLKAIIVDPSPGPSVRPVSKMEFGTETRLSAAMRAQLQKDYVTQYDFKHGSWGFMQKFLDWNSAEYAIASFAPGDQNERMARQALTGQLHLIDPVWGGAYQYSTGGDWNEPHFEKIMSVQTGDLRLFALGYAQWHDPAYLKAATGIEHFLTTFLRSPEGAFYTSQDADVIDGQHSAEYFKLDDAARRKQGIPRVDKHEYARENGWAVEALATFYAATGERRYLDEAIASAGWVMQNRVLPGGGFRHDAADAAGPYLGDTLSMGRAFLALYQVTGDRAWLARSEQAAGYLMANFRGREAGFLTSKAPTDPGYAPLPEHDENIMAARFLNLLAAYTGKSAYRDAANHAMRYLVAPQVAKELPTGGVLLASLENSSAPLHITVVGPKESPAARALFMASNSYPSDYKRVEWWDPREGPLPNADVQYPERPEPAAFICTGNSCSSPISKPEEIRVRVERLTKRQ